MADSGSEQCEAIDQLAEEFAARYRRGERPALQEYLDKYPELADDIRALFPALVEMEQIKEDRCAPAAPATAAVAPPLNRIGDYRLAPVGHAKWAALADPAGPGRMPSLQPR